MLKGKSVIELTNVKTGEKEIYEDENLVTEAVFDVLNTNLQGTMYGTSVSAIQKLNPTLIKNVNLIITGWKIRVK